jgi:CDP-paratose synthetase
MKRKVLITGITGFLGSHLAKALLAAGYEIVAIKRKQSSTRRIDSVIPKVSLHDIEGIELDAIFAKHGPIDTIIHTATCYGRNNESVSEIFEANTEFPLRLLDAGNRAGVKVFINTDTILDKYLNLYTLSKNQLLQWGRFFSIHKNICFVNIRLEHFYGADDDQTKFTAYVIRNCIGNAPEVRLTKGEQRRDFIFIDDVVAAYLVLLERIQHQDNSFSEFDVGSGQSISIREFAETVCRLAKSTTHLNFGAIPYREGEVMHSVADISGLSSLGWHCRFDLATALKIVIDQERKNA